MIWAEFYQLNLNKVPDCALGDRGVIILDGRNKKEHWIHFSRERMSQYKFVGYKIIRSERLSSEHRKILHQEGLVAEEAV
jgi:hypothetical protein